MATKAEVDRLKNYIAELEKGSADKTNKISALQRQLQDETQRATRERANAERLAPYAIGWLRKLEGSSVPAVGYYVVDCSTEVSPIRFVRLKAGDLWPENVTHIYGPIPERKEPKRGKS